MKKIDLSKTNGTLKKHLEKVLMRNHYKKEMVKSFKENFSLIERSGINQLRKSFLEAGKECRGLTAEEYADLAVETFKEVMNAKTK